MYNSLQIKNLSIACEALGRLPDAYHLYAGCKDLLDTEIKRAQEDNAKVNQPTQTQPNPDDNIPF